MKKFYQLYGRNYGLDDVDLRIRFTSSMITCEAHTVNQATMESSYQRALAHTFFRIAWVYESQLFGDIKLLLDRKLVVISTAEIGNALHPSQSSKKNMFWLISMYHR